jgi:hypothetical protein
MPAKLNGLLFHSNAMGRTTLPWVQRYPAPRAGAAAIQIRLAERSLQGIGGGDELLDLAEEDTTLPNAPKASAKILVQQLDGLDKSIDDLEDETVSAHVHKARGAVCPMRFPAAGTSSPQ